jgi:hypothetical protein
LVCAISTPAGERERDFAATDWAGELVGPGVNTSRLVYKK